MKLNVFSSSKKFSEIKAKVKNNFTTAQKDCFHEKNFGKNKFQDANVIKQDSSKRSEVNRKEEVPGPPLNLRSFT